MTKPLFDPDQFAGKGVVITGAAGIFGSWFAEAFGRAGARLCLSDNRADALAALAERLDTTEERPLTHATELREADSIAGLATLVEQEWGAADIVINNAGISGANAPVHEYPVDEWTKVVDIDLNGTFLCCRAIVPFLLKKNYGRIVNIASIAGKEGNPNASPYSAAKAGVIGLTKSLGKELAHTPITVNCITPAAVKTEIFDQISQEHIDFMLSKIPIGRFGTVDEIANLITWLTSEECSFSTGGVFDVSGGRATY